jgi:hypothetical protein
MFLGKALKRAQQRRTCHDPLLSPRVLDGAKISHFGPQSQAN